MDEDITQVSEQFAFNPEVKHAPALVQKKSFITSGVGGSALAADLLRIWKPSLDLIVHRNYGLPEIPAHRLGEYLFIANSYSGNTEEVLDGLSEALKQGMSVAVVATGGKLIEKAKNEGLPYIELAQYKIPTRLVLGMVAKALLTCMGEQRAVDELSRLTNLNPTAFEKQASELASRLTGSIPVIFSSQKNLPLSYAWQVEFNEYKTPAFSNTFPELSHNAIHGFEGVGDSLKLAQKSHFIFLRDTSDDLRIQKRIESTLSSLKERGFPTENIELTGEGFRKIFSSFFLANRTAHALESIYTKA